MRKILNAAILCLAISVGVLAQSITPSDINGTPQVARYPGATAGAKMLAAQAALPSTGGNIDLSGIRGAQSWTTCPFTGVTKNVTVIMDSATFTMGADCTIPGNVDIIYATGTIIDANGHTLTYHGGLEGTVSKHFTCSGTYVIDSTRIFAMNALYWGAVGDGSTDSTCAYQYAYGSVKHTGTVARGGLIQQFPGRFKVNDEILIYNNTSTVGPAFGSVISGPYPPACVESTVGKRIFGPAENPSWNVQFYNMCFLGTGGAGGSGWSATTTTNGYMGQHLFFDNFGESAISFSNGAYIWLNEIEVQRAVQVRTGRTAYIGACDIGPTDAVIDQMNCTASVAETTGNLGTGFVAGIVLRGANGFLRDCTGFFSETGIAIIADKSRIESCRASDNQGYSFINIGGANTFIDDYAYDGSQTGDNLYPGFHNVETANDTWDSCLAESDVTPRMSYGYTDAAFDSGGVKSQANRYVNDYDVGLAQSTSHLFSGATLKSWVRGYGNAFESDGGFMPSPTSGTLTFVGVGTATIFAGNYSPTPIPAGGTSTFTITVTGAASGDPVMIGTASGAVPNSNCTWSGFVSSTDTVTVIVSNPTVGTISPATVLWTVTVMRVIP